jgi:hypothetical protein
MSAKAQSAQHLVGKCYRDAFGANYRIVGLLASSSRGGRSAGAPVFAATWLSGAGSRRSVHPGRVAARIVRYDSFTAELSVMLAD